MSPRNHRRLCIGGGAMLAAAAISAMAARDPDEGPYGPPTALRHDCEPVAYPVEAALRHAQGVSRIRYVVDASGRVDGIEVAGEAGTTPAHRLLDAAAVGFLKGCRFDPQPSADGVPRQMDYVWRLNDIGRDRWVMVRAVDTEEPPDLYPNMVSPASCNMPSWPSEVRAKVRADDVSLRLDVDGKGAVQRAAVLHSSGQPVIDEAVRSAALHCQFQPARRKGVAVAASTQMLYAWQAGPDGLGFLRTLAMPTFDAVIRMTFSEATR